MKRLQYIAFGIAFIAILGIAGKHDFAEEVISTLSKEQYEQIKSDLGGTPSDVEIADNYLNNRQYYDDLAAINGW